MIGYICKYAPIEVFESMGVKMAVSYTHLPFTHIGVIAVRQAFDEVVDISLLCGVNEMCIRDRSRRVYLSCRRCIIRLGMRWSIIEERL